MVDEIERRKHLRQGLDRHAGDDDAEVVAFAVFQTPRQDDHVLVGEFRLDRPLEDQAPVARRRSPEIHPVGDIGGVQRNVVGAASQHDPSVRVGDEDSRHEGMVSDLHRHALGEARRFGGAGLDASLILPADRLQVRIDLIDRVLEVVCDQPGRIGRRPAVGGVVRRADLPHHKSRDHREHGSDRQRGAIIGPSRRSRTRLPIPGQRLRPEHRFSAMNPPPVQKRPYLTPPGLSLRRVLAQCSQRCDTKSLFLLTPLSSCARLCSPRGHGAETSTVNPSQLAISSRSAEPAGR